MGLEIPLLQVRITSMPIVFSLKKKSHSVILSFIHSFIHLFRQAVKLTYTYTDIHMQSTVKTIQGTLDDLVSQVTELQARCTKTEQDLDMRRQECGAGKKENAAVRIRMKQLEERMIRAEAYSRRDNLIIDGIPEMPNEDLVQKVKDIMRIDMKCDHRKINDMKFTRVHRLKNRKKTIVKFHYYQDKEYIWKHRFGLKGTKKYWLEEDFPTEIKNRRQVLEPILKAARKIPNLRSTLVGDKLFVNGQRYTVDALHLLPDPLKLQNTSLVTQGDYVYFFSRGSPFSNFFPSRFKLNGQTYSCVEQYYQTRKAAECGSLQAEMDILMSEDPAQMKAIGNSVKVNSNKWTEGKSRQVMQEGLLAKFTQNDHLRHVLVTTEGKTLVECAPRDLFWGIGLGIKQAMRTPPQHWQGGNKLGKAITELRQNPKINVDCGI